MSISKTLLIVATALCLATLVYGFDPAKPKPSDVFSASFFTMGGFGYTFTRGYYDGNHKNLRTDFFDQKGQKTMSYIGNYNLGVMYIINVTSNECSQMPTPSWTNPWGFLDTATYAGSQTLPDGKECEAWLNDYGSSKTTTCWRGNDIMKQEITAKNMVPVYAFTTDYESSVEDGAFDLPKSCSNAQKMFPNMHFKRAAQEMNLLFPQMML